MMNPAAKPDKLLRTTRFLLYVAMALVAVMGVALLVTIPAVWIFGDSIIAAAARHHIRLGPDFLTASSVLCALGLAFMALSFQFLRKLVAIIDSLGEGSPFIPLNAKRLRTMGWMVLAMQGLALFVAPIAGWMKQTVPGQEIHIVASMSLEGVIGGLLLFILARVFDRGIQLEQDIEGTV